MEFFLQGLTMGLAYVAPIGLQNLFVINTALTREKSRVFLTALIVIFFDVTLALACFYGIGAVMERSPLLERLVLLAGSLIVMYIGVGLMRAKDSLKKTDVDMPLWRVASTACVVTWFNPQALIDGTMMLGAFKASLSPAGANSFVFGVAAAAALWVFGLSAALSLFSARFTDRILRVINLVCGAVVFFYGAKLLRNFIGLVVGL
ncbi:MAG: LysE family transporter [Cloacibacillus porcorum]|nr:LysE family transporter [Cloacibacillus porcorum]